MCIAREIHRPIYEVMQMPARELNLWAAVFEKENGAPEQDSGDGDPVPTGRDAFLRLGGKVKQ